MKKTKGFTIVELLIYMGLFAIILIPLMQLFGSVIDVRLESEATSSVAQDGLYVLTRLSNDLHQSSNVLTPPLGNTGPTLHITGSSDNTYQLNGANLELNGVQLNSEGTSVSNLSFKTLGQPGGKLQVQINFTLTSAVVRSGGNAQVKDFSTTAGTR